MREWIEIISFNVPFNVDFVLPRMREWIEIAEAEITTAEIAFSLV